MIRADRYPGIPIAGWMQSHPGFGIFMSGMSLYIHKEYFSLPWQVAITVDPISNRLGFFGWCEGEVKKTGFRCVSTSPSGPADPDSGPKRTLD